MKRSAAAKRKHQKALERANKARAGRAVVAPVGGIFDVRHPHQIVRANGVLDKVRGMTTGEMQPLLDRLAGGVLLPECFRELARGRRSAWALARRVFWPRCSELAEHAVVAMCVTLLWERWLPERPSMERIDDLLEAGSTCLDAGDSLGAVEAWLAFWDALRSAAPMDAGLPELDGYLMTIKVVEWFEVFEGEAARVCDGRLELAAAVAVVRREVEARRGIVEASDATEGHVAPSVV